MKVQRITLENFRIYKGFNSIEFNPNSKGNITLVAGKNGYGKTTFLTSLVWCFYGKLMSQVEGKYRTDIKSSKGYENYLDSLLNNGVKRKIEQGYEDSDKLSVEIHLIDLSIPSIPCKSITIKREYSYITKEEKLTVLIDGDENELTKEVGYEAFINDFILPREIAKFFFFDAEKIVSLAEAKSKVELQSLSRAYSEVLGIKKYEELKKNLESLHTKLRRNGIDNFESEKLKSLIDKENELNSLIEYNQAQQDDKEKESSILRTKIDELQEKLIREGNEISVEELMSLKAERNRLQQRAGEIKIEFKKLLELAPFVIASKQLLKLNEQLVLEQKVKSQILNPEILKSELNRFSENLLKKIGALDDTYRSKLEDSMQEALKDSVESLSGKNAEGKLILDFSEEAFRDFQLLLKYLKTSYKEEFKRISKADNENKTLLSIVNKKIKEAEARKDDPLAKKLRDEKKGVTAKHEQALLQRDNLKEEFGELKSKLSRQVAIRMEYEKNFKLQQADKKKYTVTENLLFKINELIQRIKEDKKFSLQKAIALSLKKLMHKENFIYEVKVDILEDVMDIKLLDVHGSVINKEALSKGEQQLYATALLKALVDESGINFPVFIDSPLQKFDKLHSEKIIREFYPAISDQVVLFPLLEKELSEREFWALEPNLNQIIEISNSEEGSVLRPVKAKQLFQVHI